MNLMLSDLVWLSALIILAALWWHGQGVKARAVAHARLYCEQHDLQWLDESMVIRRLWPVRSRSGSLVLQRTYFFEFSSTGEYRYRGAVIMEGYNLKSVDVQTYHMQ
ncbi:MAG: DUF3301 domain-containing protein [Reinekea sp.]|jgi:hypothetical protein